jgi:glycosyltransferase involved in cell wall biosynthesis
MGSNSKVVVLYRVVQHWRVPIFERLNAYDDTILEVWHGPDFPGTKVVSGKGSFTFKHSELFSFKISLKSKNGHIFMPFSPFLIFSLIRSNPNVVVCEGASNLFNSFQAYIYCKLFGKRFVWWSLGKILNRSYDPKRGKIDRLIQHIERTSNAIISYSTRGKEYFRSIGVSDDKIFVAVNVIDTETTIKKAGQIKESNATRIHEIRGQYAFVTLFVGALTAEKSIDKLIRAQRIIEDKGYNALLLIVGGGPEQTQLSDLATQLKLKHVQFAGSQVEHVAAYFMAGDIFALPGLGGLAISEAMCYGLPIISSIGDGCEGDLVTDKNGVLDPEMTPERLATYIERYYHNRNLINKHGQESFKIINESLTVQNYVSQVRNAIHG